MKVRYPLLVFLGKYRSPPLSDGGGVYADSEGGWNDRSGISLP